ncbi:hypothetical protein, partial [Alistipes finegoldii]|uniref:hypothetical protein n=1 Tax=Alistipes finegoldii TaxID=214856 RepID=UPI003FD80873
HKNPSEDGLRENRFRPQHEAARCALSLGAKVEASEMVFPRPKTPKAVIPTPQAIIHFQSDKNCDFSLFICHTNQRMTVGRDER